MSIKVPEREVMEIVVDEEIINELVAGELFPPYSQHHDPWGEKDQMLHLLIGLTLSRKHCRAIFRVLPTLKWIHPPGQQI